jgi:hypothetical protein
MQEYTTHTAIVVQKWQEKANHFASRINDEITTITEKLGGQMTSPPIVMMTSAADGRQTATIQFFRALPSKDEPLFDTNLFIAALEGYDNNEHPEVFKFVNWMLAQKKADYIRKFPKSTVYV